MSEPAAQNSSPVGDIIALLMRWGLGGLFIYMGVHKALDPVYFLKLIRQYNVLHDPFWLNLVASTLPWFEIFCGVLLVLGIAVRGSSLLLVAMLVPFTILIYQRALDLQTAKSLAFCAVKFDCGCGAGEVFVCRKLTENVLLTLVALGLVFWQRRRFCVRYDLAKS